MKRWMCSAVLSASHTCLLHSQVQSHHNQQVTGNNNKVTQVNVTKIIQQAAADSGIPGSWDRILLPDHLASPHVGCEDQMAGRANAAFTVYYGGGLSYCPESGCALVSAKTISPSGERKMTDLVRVDRAGSNLVVSAKLFSEDGRIAAELERGKTYKADALVPYVKRPDSSTLVIVDTHGDPILTLHYLNQRALWMEGVFYKPFPDIPGHIPQKVTITADRVIFPGNNVFSGSCTSNNNIAFAF